MTEKCVEIVAGSGMRKRHTFLMKRHTFLMKRDASDEEEIDPADFLQALADFCCDHHCSSDDIQQLLCY